MTQQVFDDFVSNRGVMVAINVNKPSKKLNTSYIPGMNSYYERPMLDTVSVHSWSAVMTIISARNGVKAFIYLRTF